MPHDRYQRLVCAGDIVSIDFRVLSVDSEDPESCNVTLVACVRDGYAPHIVCRSKITTLSTRAGAGSELKEAPEC